MVVERFHHLPASEFFVSLPFWGYFAATVLIYRTARLNLVGKQWLLLACNLCMLLALPRFSFTMLIILLGLCGLTYVCARQLLSGTGSKNGRMVVAGFGLAAILLTLAFFKYGFVQELVLQRNLGPAVGASKLIFLIGISYSSFKAMHFILEAYQRNLKAPNFFTFLNYILFFPSFISGPINLYNHFCETFTSVPNATFRADFVAGGQRILDGLFKKLVLAAVCFPYTLTNLHVPIHDMPAWQILLGLYAYALYFYFDFSGYTDLAIGSARLLGIVLPENFDWPFLKKNIQQFWANWHISLTSWLTTYVYWPLVRALRNGEFFRRHPILLSNIAIIVTFVACGIWHGDTLTFVLWGCYHGVGIAMVNTYQYWKRKVRHPFARWYFSSTYSRMAGILMTFNFFAAGQLLFVLDSQQIRILLKRFL